MAAQVPGDHPDQVPHDLRAKVVNDRGQVIQINQLTDEQKAAVRRILDQAKLDRTKRHYLDITVHQGDRLTVVVDQKFRFAISKTQVNNQYTAVLDKVKKGGFIRTVADFFRAIANFFYQPTFPDPALRRRTPREAIQQDYRALRKSLEEGKQWVAHGTSAEREQLHSQIDDLITHAKAVEKALLHHDQGAELEKLLVRLSQEVMALPDGGSLSVPVGYLNRDGVLQPVLLRYIKRGDNVTLEIYADANDGKENLAPLHVRNFVHANDLQFRVEDSLVAFFNPIIVQSGKKKVLIEASRENRAFETLFEAKQSEALRQMAAVKTEKPEAVQSQRPTTGLTFESILHGVDGQMGDRWAPPAMAEQERKGAPPTPAARVVGWFDQLISQDENKFTKHEKLNFLYSMTNQWIEDQFKQLNNSSLSQEAKLAGYTRCLENIRHVKSKIAKALNEGNPVDPFGIPHSLLEKERFCHEKISSLTESVKAHQEFGTRRVLSRPHTAALNVPLPPVGPSFAQPEAEVAPVGAQPAPQFPAVQDVSPLRTLFSPDRLERQVTQQAIVQLAREIGVQPQEILEAFSTHDSFDAFVATILSNNGYLAQILAESSRSRESRLNLPSDQFISIILDLIRDPRKIPEYQYKNLDASNRYLIRFLHNLHAKEPHENPQTEKAFSVLRALLDLRHVLPISQKEEIILTAEQGVGAFQSELIENIHALTTQINALREAAALEQNPERKRSLLQLLKDRSIEALEILPAPGTEGALGIPSIWNGLSPEQRELMMDSLYSLEKNIWEVQMKLAVTEMTGKESFMLVKGQAIRLALLRQESDEQKQRIEGYFTEHPERLINVPGVIQDEGTVRVNLNQFNEQSVNRIRTIFQENPPPPEGVEPAYLLMNRYTLDYRHFNQLLTQDLTTCLSADPKMENDLLSLYHFLTREYHVTGDRHRPSFITIQEPFSQGNDAVKKAADQMIKSDLFYRVARDPDFTLYNTENGETPRKGLTFFQQKPETLFRETNIDLRWEDGEKYYLAGGENQSLAEIKLEGHENPDYRPSPKLPVLPTINNNPNEGFSDFTEINPYQDDLRTKRPLDAWIGYIEQRIAEENLVIPPQVIKELFAIRQAPNRGANSNPAITSYQSDTAIRALNFIVNPANQSYLEYDFVQKFIEESLFGPFVMQQALVYHPQIVSRLIDEIEKCYDHAVDNNNALLSTYFSHLLMQLQGQVHFTKRQYESQGVFSGLIHGGLPVGFGMGGGSLKEGLQDRHEFKDKPHIDIPLSVSEQWTDPVGFLMRNISNCSEKLDALVDKVKEQPQMSSETIAQVKDPKTRKLYSIALLEEYRLKWPDLETEELKEVMEGYRLLIDPTIQGGIPSQCRALAEWVRNDVIPKIYSHGDRDSLLNALLTTEIPTSAKWEPDPQLVSNYRLELPNRMITVDLATMEITGVQGVQEQAKIVPLPNDVTCRDEVRKALNAKTVTAKMTKRGGQTRYEWDHEGQTFTINTVARELEMKRVIRDGLFAGTYTFQSVALEHLDSPSHALLSENGIWRKEGEADRVYLFSSGMDRPSEKTAFVAPLTQGRIVALQTLDGSKRLSTVTDQPSPFPFISPHDLLTLMSTRTKRAVEFRMESVGLTIKLDERNWNCYQNGVLLGPLHFPEGVEGKRLTETFGRNWKEYVIPLEGGKYVMIPYLQRKGSKGQWEADQASLSTLSGVELFHTTEAGTIEGSMSGHLYLADRFIREGNIEKNPTIAREKYLQAEKYLAKLKAQRPPKDPQQVAQLKNLFERITQNPPLSMAGAPSSIGLALSLRLGLTIHTFRRLAKEQGVSSLELTPKGALDELERMTKMYEAYLVVHRDGAYHKEHKKVFELSLQELGELDQIASQLLKTFAEDVAFEAYFGSSGRLASIVEMPHPDRLDPQFLLALIRMAKPVDGAISLKHFTTPLPLGNLLENFWSYFSSIQRDAIRPENLLFLFEESLIPHSTPEEEQRLKNLDQQARQFLLSWSKICATRNEVGDPMAFGRGKIAQLKEQMNAFITVDFKGQSGLFSEWQNLQRNVESMEIHEIENSNLPDIDRLVRDTKALDTNLNNFLDGLERTILQAERFLAEVKNELEKIDVEIQKCEGQIAQLNSELTEVRKRESSSGQSRAATSSASGSPEMVRIHNQIQEVKSRQEQLIDERTTFLKTERTDPIFGNLISNMETLDQYEKTLNLDEMKQHLKIGRERNEDLKKGIKEIEKKKELFSKVMELDNFIIELSQRRFSSDPAFELPEKGAALETIMGLARGEPPSISMSVVASFVKEVGIVKGVKLVQRQEEVMWKLEHFAKPLVALTFAPALVPPIQVNPRNRSRAEQPIALEAIFIHPHFTACFTPDQIHEIQRKGEQLDAQKQKKFAEKLSEALGLHASIVHAQTGLAYHIKRVDHVYRNKVSSTLGPQDAQGVVELPGENVPDGGFDNCFEDRVIEDNTLFFKALVEQTLQENDHSPFAEGLRQGLENLKGNDPTACPRRVRTEEDDITRLRTQINTRCRTLSNQISANEREIVSRLKSMALAELPPLCRQIVLREGTDRELLEAAFSAYSKGAFSQRLELDRIISRCLINKTKLNALNGPKRSALQVVGRLNLQDEASLRRESNVLNDLLFRCQSDVHLRDLPPSLGKHLRKIIYVQNRLGIVLRKNQLDTLQEIIEKPNLLKQLRMGLGKTSTILPFALEILASEGYIPIGIVPRALFSTNFDEMDETTRAVFELSGNEFLFNRQDAPQPFSTLNLLKLSKKCEGFFSAIDRGEYILTTIESKASLDDKINEVELSQSFLNAQLSRLGDDLEGEKQRQDLMARLGEHQVVLDLLYRVKATFEAEKTRLVIDEVDQVARPNYAVNSEIGAKIGPSPILQTTVATVFDFIRTLPELKLLLQAISSNTQFTLTDEEINGFIKILAENWLGDRIEYFRVDKKELLNWFAGGKSPFTSADVIRFGPAIEELKVMRKALNSSLRSSLGLKVGLSGEFDPIHQAVGVPASQGITSKTTKYSDPLMQLCLTYMIAMYKPQGETFLKSAAPKVLEQMKRDLQGNPILGAELAPAIEKLETLLLRQKNEENPPKISERIDSSDPVDLLLRTRFAGQVAPRKLVYMSEGQLSRPVKHALRGCNVIGLSGTGRGEGIEARETTAEVLYRMVSALPERLATPVETYPVNSNEALNTFRTIVNGDYRFLINQAGACDKLSLNQIVVALHLENGRPIVFLNIDEEGRSAKSVLINNKIQPLDRLSDPEKEVVKERGFYYYHTPHVRGTHFDIPTGSRGALMLSPKVNADDRDQAAYRARELGEGHTVVPFISESLKKDKGINTIADMLRHQHIQTREDEAEENLSEFQLRIRGVLVRAADELKESVQLNIHSKTPAEWGNQNHSVENRALIQKRAILFDLLRRFFVQEGGNETYLRQLDREIFQGEERETLESLRSLADSEIARIKILRKQLADELPDEDPLIGVLVKAIQDLKGIKDEMKKNALLANRLPPTTVGSSKTEGVQETEAEAEEEQETTSETEGETLRRSRILGTEGVFGEIDLELLDSIQPSGKEFQSIVREAKKSNLIDEYIEHETVPLLESSEFTFVLTHRMNFLIESSSGGELPEMNFVVVETRGKHLIFAADPMEANEFATVGSPLVATEKRNPEIPFYFSNGFSIKVGTDFEGNTALTFYSDVSVLAENEKVWKEKSALRAEMYLALMHCGYTQFSDKTWSEVKRHCRNLTEEGRAALRESLTKALQAKNPAFLRRVLKRI